MGGPLLELTSVTRREAGITIVDHINWTVRSGEHWVVLGPNGSGKTTLLRMAALLLHPTRGEVTVLGETLGRTDVRTMRSRIGYASAALADSLRPTVTAEDVVVTSLYGALEPWWHDYRDDQRKSARDLLDRVGCGHRTDHRFGTLSSGERQRVLVARILMADPELLLLDEPTAALDLAGREQLVVVLGALAADPSTPPMVLVTHHVEEIPAGFTHGLLMADGCVVASGRLETVLTETNLARCFGVEVSLAQTQGRWSARVDGGTR